MVKSLREADSSTVPEVAKKYASRAGWPTAPGCATIALAMPSPRVDIRERILAAWGEFQALEVEHLDLFGSHARDEAGPRHQHE
jgi:hypothetical protein